MASVALDLQGETLLARPTGALYWPDRACLVVSDLHLGRSERYARRAGALLPPYELDDTLTRLDRDIAEQKVEIVVCLGDTFDDPEASDLSDRHRLWLTRLMAGRSWIWIAGNHDPGPVDLGGTFLAELMLGPLVFRHIAQCGAKGEVSGHYHPKARVAGRAYPCFLADEDRVIVPAYGTYTGGLHSDDAALATLMRSDARAILTGNVARVVPMPKGRTGNG